MAEYTVRLGGPQVESSIFDTSVSLAAPSATHNRTHYALLLPISPTRHLSFRIFRDHPRPHYHRINANEQRTIICCAALVHVAYKLNEIYTIRPTQATGWRIFCSRTCFSCAAISRELTLRAQDYILSGIFTKSTCAGANVREKCEQFIDSMADNANNSPFDCVGNHTRRSCCKHTFFQPVLARMGVDQ